MSTTRRKKKAAKARTERAKTRRARKAPASPPRKPAIGRKERAATPAARGTAAARNVARDAAHPAAHAKLATYHGKRDFQKTPEPQGKRRARRKKSPDPAFVIQKHAARALHYDFRLEIDGVLKSWAVPKGPSLDPGEKRLAVQTEDHPLDYADFEGVIPPGEYGGGSVIVWDVGTFRNLKPEASLDEWLRRGHVEVWLEGEKVRGGYALVNSKLGGQAKNWLLVKMRDDAASATLDPVAARPESVVSGRTVEEVAGAGKRRRT
jgi:DNA ligase D-like protein (predicted 3'-phosphoesterase)